VSIWLKPIRCYVSLAGTNKISAWYEGLLPQECADADEFIKNMRKTREWKMPNYRPSLRGYERLGELRWVSEKKQHRLIGYLQGGTFYALVGCTHKQQIYDPSESLDTADKRRRQIERGDARTVAYDL
jgi:hypothetical protein